MMDKDIVVTHHDEQSQTSGHSDVEKPNVTYDRTDTESDRVTLKTWAVVVVSFSTVSLAFWLI